MANQTYSLIVRHDILDNEVALFYIPNDKISNVDRDILDRWKEISLNDEDEIAPVCDLIKSYAKYKKVGHQKMIVDNIYSIYRDWHHIV